MKMINTGNTNTTTFILIVLLTLFSCNLFAQEHPRMYFSKGELENVQTRGNSSHKALKDQIVGYVEKELGSSPAPSRNQSTLRLYGSKVYTFAFAYILTGDSRYAELTKDYLLTFASWEYWDTQPDTRDLALSAMLIGNALAYDWIYDYLNETERLTIRNSLSVQAEKMYQAAIAGSNVSGWNNWWSNSFLQNHTIINRSALGVAGLVLQGEDDSADKYIENARQGWERISALMDGNGDGSWHESTNYGAYAFTNALVYLVNMKKITGTDLIPHKFFSAYGKWRIYNHIPGTIENIVGMGDFENSWGDNSGPHILRFAASEYGDGYAQWMADEIINIRGRYTNAWQAPEAVLEFFNYNPAVAASSPGSLPKDATFKDLEGVIWRSGWGNDAMIFAFKTGANGGRFAYDSFMANSYPWSPASAAGQSNLLNLGHDHNDLNSFYLYKNGSWLAPENNEYGKGETSFHNSILINGKGQYAPQDDNWNNYSRSAGRNDGRLEEVLITPNFNFLSAQASNAYSHISGLKSYQRSVFLSSKGYLLMFDVFQSSSSNTYTWVNHFGQSVARDGKWVKGHSNNNQLLGVLPLNENATVESGNDGSPYVHIAATGQNLALINLLVPATTDDWAARPAAELLKSLENGSEVKVTMADGSSDIWLYSYDAKSEKTFSSYKFDGEKALISSNSNDVVVRLALFGTSSLSDAVSGEVIIDGLNADKDYEILYQGTTLKILGEVDVTRSVVKVYARNIQKILVNDIEVDFIKTDDIAYLGLTAKADLPPVNVSVSPANGSGMDEIFSAKYSDPEGEMDYLEFRISGNNQVLSLRYDIAASKIMLANDAASGWEMATPGQATVLENSLVQLNVASVSYSQLDGSYTLIFPLKFKNVFEGQKAILLNAVDAAANASGWQQKGSYNVTSPPAAPEIISFSPESGSGSSQLFTIRVVDNNGVDDLSKLYFTMNGKVNRERRSFQVFFNASNNIVKIREDSGWSDGISLLNGGFLAGENATLDVNNSRVIRSENQLELQLNLKFSSLFSGDRNLKVNVIDESKLKTGYQNVGQFFVAVASSAPEIKFLKTTSNRLAVGETEIFEAAFTDKDGDFGFVEIQLRPENRNNVRATVRYQVNSGNLMLQDKKGEFSISRKVSAGGVLENDYICIDLAKSKAKENDGVLTIELSACLNSPLLGEVDAILYAEDSTGKNSGYQQKSRIHLKNKKSRKPAILTAEFSADSQLLVKSKDGNGADDIYYLEYSATSAASEKSFDVRVYKETGGVHCFDHEASQWVGPYNSGENLVVDNSYGKLNLKFFSFSSARKIYLANMSIAPSLREADLKQMVRVVDYEGNTSSWKEVTKAQDQQLAVAGASITEENGLVTARSQAIANWNVSGIDLSEEALKGTDQLTFMAEKPGIYSVEARHANSRVKELITRSTRVGLDNVVTCFNFGNIFDYGDNGEWRFAGNEVNGLATSPTPALILSKEDFQGFFLKTSFAGFFGSHSSGEIQFSVKDQDNYFALEICQAETTIWTLKRVVDGEEIILEEVETGEMKVARFELLVYREQIVLSSGDSRLIHRQLDADVAGGLGLKINGKGNRITLKDLIFAEVF